MILVVADDLLFRSKISSAAKALGVVVRAATTPDAALERAREDRPTLVLIDLDGQRPAPFEVLQRFADDPVLRDLETVGFEIEPQTVRQMFFVLDNQNSVHKKLFAQNAPETKRLLLFCQVLFV